MSQNIQEVLAYNKKLEDENEKLKKENEGVHALSQAFAESRREGSKLKDTIRILTHQLSSASSASLGSISHSDHSDTVTDETLYGLAGQLGTNWRSLVFRLDIQTDEIDKVQKQYESPKEQIYHILRTWKQKQAPPVDVRLKLTSALERTGLGDLAETLKKCSSENVTETNTLNLPWFVDIVSLEYPPPTMEWKQLAEHLGVTEFDVIMQLPPAERMYGAMDNWLKGLNSGVNPIRILVSALKDSGRPDVADKIIAASKARNEYVEEWSMQQTSVKLDGPPETAQNDTMHGIPSLKKSIQNSHISTSRQDSVRSFGSRESMGLFSEPESKRIEEQHVSLSFQIKDIIEKANTTEFEGSELTNGLAKMLPKSVQQDKELHQLRALRHATMEQNTRFKEEIADLKPIIIDLRMENKQLKNELADLKKVKQDENLQSFEVVTKGDAYALKREEKKSVEVKQGAASPDRKTVELTPVIIKLRKENSGLKKQIDEILKVNNEWDQHYAGMKTSYETKLKKAEDEKQKMKEDLDHKLNESKMRMAADNQKESILDKKQREFDQMLAQAKARIDTVESEKAEHQERSARLEKWVHILLTKKAESEGEINRLNQELEKSMMTVQPPVMFEVPRGATAPAAMYGMQIPRERDNAVEQKLKEQMDLLQQQNMAFQSDFNQERRDRQNVVGKLAEAEEEVKNLRKIAMDLEEQVKNYETDRRVKRPPGYKSYYIQEVPARRNLVRRGVNYGGNDNYIDGDLEIDCVDGGSIPANENSECPVCQKVITDERELERHVERCTNNFD